MTVQARPDRLTGSGYQFLRKHIGMILLLPALLIHLSVVALPALSTVVMSLYDWNGIGAAKYIGFGNFLEIFTQDEIFWRAMKNNTIWMLLFLTVPLIIGMLVAVMVTRVKHLQMVYRTVIFIPYVIASITAGKIWAALLNPYFGIPTVFKMLGWNGLASISWLGNKNIVLYTVAFVDNWHWWGFVMVLFVAALHQVDPDLYECIRIEGANKLQEFCHVTVPGIRPTLAFIVSLSLMWSFLTFDYVWAMTQGGPGQATEILSTWIYRNAFNYYRSGYANALCVVQSGIILIIFSISRIFVKKAEE